MRKRERYKPPVGLFLGFFFLVQAFTNAGAQQVYAYHAALDTIKEDAFYKIELQPELVARCRSDFADLRILAAGGQFVPYVLKELQATGDPSKQWLAIPGGAMTKLDSNDKHSYITLKYIEAYQVDWLAFTVRSPVFYKREAQIAAEGAQPGEWTWITNIVIDPRHLRFRIPVVKTRRLRIDIANADNAPLTIDRVAGFQAARYLLTYLQADSVYQVLAGNPQAAAPEYDLKYFTDSLNKMPQMLVPGHVEPARIPVQPVAAAEGSKAVTGRSSGLLLWSSLLAVLLLLIYFSIRMVRAIAQRETYDRI